MDAMSALDSAFLALEDVDPHAGLHIGSIGVFEGPPPSHDDMLRAFDRKLPLVPRYRQRVRRLPFSLGPPVWIDDVEFDLRYHVRRTALPAPGDDALLQRLVGRLMSQRLDRDKPMWEAWVVEGLTDDRWALLSKVHHCMVDGISGTDLLAVMLDLTKDAELPPVQVWQPAPEPSTAALVAAALLHQAAQPIRLAPGALRAVRSPRRSLASVGRFARGAAAYVGDLRPFTGSSIAGPIGAHRRYRWTSVSFDDLRAVRAAFGGTLNDVSLAAVTAGLRELLLSRREAPGVHSVRTLVPVSTRAAGDESTRDNQVTAMLVELPVHLSDPIDQLTAVQREMARHKRTGEAAAGAVITRIATMAPAELVQPALRLFFRVPQQQLTTVTTNVPGPSFPLYAFGRQMLAAYPYVPIGDRLRVGIAMFSYCGRMSFGVTADAATTPDADLLVSGIERGAAALVARSHGGAVRRRTG